MASDIIQTITEVLKQTKEDGKLSSITTINAKALEHLGLSISNGVPVHITRTQRIELAMMAVKEGENIADIVDLLTWKDFEGFVATILSENSYRCVESYRRRGNSSIQGMEIDVIGLKGDSIIAIDAKMWSIRSGKVSSLKKAAEKQKKRTRELTKELDRLSQKMKSLDEKVYRVFPVLVTWLVEEVEIHEGVPVVPIFKLNSFILDLDQFEDVVVSYSGRYSRTSS